MGTRSLEGIENLGLFFSVIHVGANPPLLGILFRPHTVTRHSLENLRATGFATLNSVSPSILKQAHAASANYDSNESEPEILGLEYDYKDFPAPYLTKSKVQIGISWQEEHLVKANETIFVVAAIEEVHLEPTLVLEDGLVDHSLADNLTVNGLDSYYLAQPFKRYAYARPHREIEEKEWQKKQ